MATATTSKLRAIPTGAALGADVEGFDIGRVSDADMAFIRDAWLRHLVLRFRGQDFDDRVHRDFSRRFGPLDMAPSTKFNKPWLPEFPEMSRITNIMKDGQPTGTLGSGELVWHTDMSYIDTPRPYSSTILRTRPVTPGPPHGGASMASTSYILKVKFGRATMVPVMVCACQ